AFDRSRVKLFAYSFLFDLLLIWRNSVCKLFRWRRLCARFYVDYEIGVPCVNAVAFFEQHIGYGFIVHLRTVAALQIAQVTLLAIALYRKMLARHEGVLRGDVCFGRAAYANDLRLFGHYILPSQRAGDDFKNKSHRTLREPLPGNRRVND